MLGVRQQTCSDLVYLELGKGSAKAEIKRRQLAFLKGKQLMPEFEYSLLGEAIRKAKQCRSQMGKYIMELEILQVDPVAQELQTCQQRVKDSGSSRRLIYQEINPTLEEHEVYKANVPEHHRVAFSRLRLSSHRLKCETGRWSRLPVEQRLCSCGVIQTESHVLIECPLTEEIRSEFSTLNFNGLTRLMQSKDLQKMCLYISKALKIYEST